MNKTVTRRLIAASVALPMLALVGCSSPQKNAKGSSTASTDSMTDSTKKLGQDFAQTESDFGKLQNQLQVK